MKIDLNVAEVLQTDLLAGRALGSRHLALLMAKISQALDAGQLHGVHDAEKVLVTLDFARVRAVTSSYLASAIWPLWIWETALRSNVYPVLANLDPGVRDEIEFALKARNAAVWVCQSTSEGAEYTFLGGLDDSLGITLRNFGPLVELSATDLASSGEQIGATAWNNRLTALNELRLLHRRKQGRRQVYSLSWSEVCHG